LKVGKLKGWKVGRLKVGELESWKIKGWKVARLKVESYNLANLQTCNLQPANLQPATCKPANLQTCKPANLQTCKPANVQLLHNSDPATESVFGRQIGRFAKRLKGLPGGRARIARMSEVMPECGRKRERSQTAKQSESTARISSIQQLP
jgi:uncharacterized protein YjbI with pentapeptide repeats